MRIYLLFLSFYYVNLHAVDRNTHPFSAPLILKIIQKDWKTTKQIIKSHLPKIRDQKCLSNLVNDAIKTKYMTSEQKKNTEYLITKSIGKIDEENVLGN